MKTNADFSRADSARIQSDPDHVREYIAKRAYFMYLNSAASHGDDLKHWLLAEKQTKSEGKRRKL